MLANTARAGMAVGKFLKLDNNYEGAWHGNDTVWRMTLDLQRVLHYGRPDGTLADDIKRTVLTITDAIIAGEGDGPLSPTSARLGMLTLGTNSPALDWVHALLMGLDPQRIPLIREAFSQQRWMSTNFSPFDIAVKLDGHHVGASELFRRYGRAFRPPHGWKGHIELGCAAKA